VGPLGSGLGGGVELTLYNIAQELVSRGHIVRTLAPMGSEVGGLDVVEIPGNLQLTTQAQERNDPVVIPSNAVLAKMLDYAYNVQQEYDLLVNFAYDWLPFYLTPFFQTPIAHLVSMGSLTTAMDHIISTVAEAFPGTIGVHSRGQAETFAFADRCRCLANGLDLSLYEFCAEPDDHLAWIGRIAPEKGIEDALAAVHRSGIPLKVWGAMPDQAYWQRILENFPDAPVRYEGFLPTQKLQKGLGKCRGLLMTPHWVEAFGNVAMEALACGVPVIAYRRGGPEEIVRHGKTGWLVEPESVDGLVEAIARLDEIDRHACRQQAEDDYSMAAMGDRVEAWFEDILTRRTGEQSA
jgi:UDP-glucose:tetrahydrobiopterin glucosyltransferase